MLTVSIVTPSYQQGAYIEETIQSVLQQQTDGVDYCVMDAGSTDQTVSILERYASRLKWVSEKDNGQAHAVNKAIAVTSGDIIGWLNSDDIYYPDAIASVRQYFIDHPEVDVIYGDTNNIDQHGQFIESYPIEPWNIERLKVNCYISQPSTFFRRSVVQRCGGLDESLQLCMDYEYWLRLALQGVRFAYLPKVLAGARIYPETKSSRFLLVAHREAVSVLFKLLGSVPPAWLVNYASAKSKTELGIYKMNSRVMVFTWLNLWAAAGLHASGIKRAWWWVKMQWVMLGKVVGKFVSRISGLR